MFYLAYGGSCASCSNIAHVIEDEADMAISVRSIESINSEFGTNLDYSKPALINIYDNDIKDIYTGPKMSLKILQLVGPQKSAKIFSAIASEKSGKGVNRRSTLTGFAVAAGLALTGASLTGASAKPVEDEVAVSEKVKIYNDVIIHKAFQAALEKAKGDGYAPNRYEYVVVRQDNGFLFFYFMEHSSRPETDAAVVSCSITGGSFDFSLEYVSGAVGQATRASSVGNVLTFSQPSNYSALPMGPVEYFGCVSLCVGANCGVQASRCRFLIHMAAVLACMTAICGSKVRTCHNICRRTW